MFFTGDSSVEFFVYFPMSGIKTAIAYHLVMLFRDMLDEALNEFHNRNGFFYVNITVRRSRLSGVARATCPD